MSKEKDKLAAVMINHWYVIARALEIGRIQRHPRSKNYAELAKAVEAGLRDDFSQLTGKFTSYTTKNFYANIQHLITADPDIVGEDGATGLRVEFGNVTQRRGMPISIFVDSKASEVRTIIDAMIYPDQHPLVKTLLEELPPLVIADSDYGVFQILIPSVRRRVSENFLQLEKEVLTTFNNIKSALKLAQIVSAALTDENKREIVAGTSIVKILQPSLSNGLASIEGIEVEETENARNQRILRLKLAERLRKRTQTATAIDLDIERQTVTYRFDGQEHEPLVLNLDLITNW